METPKKSLEELKIELKKLISEQKKEKHKDAVNRAIKKYQSKPNVAEKKKSDEKAYYEKNKEKIIKTNSLNNTKYRTFYKMYKHLHPEFKFPPTPPPAQNTSTNEIYDKQAHMNELIDRAFNFASSNS